MTILASAHASGSGCSGILQRRIIQPIKNSQFIQETRATKGCRLILKGIKEPRPPYHGFFKKSFGGLLRPTPVAGLYHQFVRRPSGVVTRKIFGRALEPAGLITLPAAAVLSALAWNAADDYYNVQLARHIQQEITENRADLENLLQYDFRYRFAREEYEKGNTTKHQELEQAFRVKIATNTYLETVKAAPSLVTSSSGQETFLKYPEFLHLQPILANGPPVVAGYTYDHPGKKPDEKQAAALFQIIHRLSVEYMLIADMLGQTEEYAKMRRVPEFSRMVHRVETDPYDVEAMKLVNEGRLSRYRAQYLMQNFLREFACQEEMDVLGFHELKAGPDGRLTGEVITVEDIRNEMLKDLQQETQKPINKISQR